MVKSKFVVVKTPTEPAPPVSVIESLSTGFETVAARASLMVLPLLLDLFLWLGPHLSISPLTHKFSTLLEEELVVSSTVTESRLTLTEVLQEAGEHLNVFSFVSTAPLGIPSLMAAKAPMQTPSGQPPVWTISGELQLITLFLGFTLIGLLLGSAYFAFIARWISRDEEQWDLQELFRRIWVYWARLVAFVLVISLLIAALSIPLLLLVGLAGLLSQTLANIVLSVGFAAGLWFFLYIGFAVHGIVLKDRGLMAAIWESVRLVQWNMPGVVGLFTLVLIISWGLGFVWNIPEADTWLLLAGIAGHAFVTTGLIAATFVFYEDRHRWWNELREYRRQLIAQEQARRSKQST